MKTRKSDGNCFHLITCISKIPVIIVVAAGLSGCTANDQNTDNMEYSMPEPSAHEYKYTADFYNSGNYIGRTNCYAYAFDIIDNPVTGEQFYTRDEASLLGVQQQ